MKKSLKIILFSLLGLIGVLFILFLYINISGIPHYDVEPEELTVEPTEARLVEGARLAMMLCVQCHGSTDGKMGGAHMSDVEVFGEIYSPNITQHPEYGITDYTDGELAYLFRSGVRKDGQYVPPWMPKFPGLSDEDLYSIIAFLRSDHPLVQPSDNNPPDVKPSFLAKFLSRVAFKPLPYPEEPIAAPPISDKVAYGKYLVDYKIDCYSCHSASFTKVDLMNPPNSKGYLGGGNPLIDKEGNMIHSSNLTMDDETGLGTWTEEEFNRTLKYGMKPDGTPIRYPMVPYTPLTDEEVSAIWAYLKSVPVIHNPEDEAP